MTVLIEVIQYSIIKVRAALVIGKTRKVKSGLVQNRP